MINSQIDAMLAGTAWMVFELVLFAVLKYTARSSELPIQGSPTP